MAKKGSKPTVRTDRRRDTKRDPGDRRRAEAPKRRREQRQPRPSGAGGSTRPPSGGSSSPRPISFGGSGGTKMSPIVMIILVILFLCVGGPIALLTGGGDDGGGLLPSGGNDPIQEPPPAQSGSSDGGFSSSQGDSAPVINPPSGDGQTWLVMLYQDADDKILEQDIYLDLNEAELVGSSDRVHIVAQIDRYQAGYSGDGNWSSARRFYVTKDNDLNRVSSQVVEDGGEVNMADGQTLVDFVTWAVENYPADKHVLIMSDHGLGWPGGWSDSDSKTGGTGGTNVPLASALGDQIYLMELDEALGTIRAETGIDSFELVGMDACLMGHVEVFSALAPHANYAVASQEVEPALGWAYTGFLQDLVNNPDMDGAGLGQAIVDSYISDDQRIVDDQARAELLRQTGGGGLSGLFGLFGGGGGTISPAQLAQQMGKNSTISAVNLNTLADLNNSLNTLALAMQNENQRTVAQVRTYAQSYTNVFGNNVPPSYIDLGHFAQLLKQQSSNSAVIAAVDEVLAAIDRAVIAEKHGPDKPAASGVSIYFPNSQIFAVPAAGPASYTVIAQRFSEVSLWDDFLTFHYTGQTFEAGAVTASLPNSSAVRGPGSEQIQLSPITASSSVAAPGQPVLLSTDVTGQNIGYAYFFAGFIDSAANSIFIADSDYLESGSTGEVSGAFYPIWPDTDTFTLEFEWDPLVFAITDGVQSVVAHFTPRTYGETSADAVYTVDGIYTYADGGETRSARLYFQDGALKSVYGFSNEDGTGAPREIVPNQGDTFTILEEWMDLDASGNQVATVSQTGGTLTFSDQTFTWEELIAAEGDYVVGFIVEDLDGNQFQVFTQVEVQ